MEKKIIVLGGMGVSERRDRDPDRILSGGVSCTHSRLTFRQTDHWLSRSGKRTVVIGMINKDGYELSNRVYDKRFLAPTIRTFQGGSLEPKVVKKYEKSND